MRDDTAREIVEMRLGEMSEMIQDPSRYVEAVKKLQLSILERLYHRQPPPEECFNMDLLK